MSRRRAKQQLCPNIAKVGYDDEATARAALTRIETEHHSEHIPNRAYRCRCGRWHLTSKAKLSTM